MLTLELDKEKSRLIVELKGSSKRTFSLPLIDYDDRPQKVPALDFPISVVMDSSVFSDAIDDVDVVSESVLLKAASDRFIVAAEGDLSHANVDLPAGDGITIKAPSEAKAKYSIEYLKKIIKGAKLAPQVTVQFNKDYPLKCEYKAVDRMLLAFILAPRVEND